MKIQRSQRRRVSRKQGSTLSMRTPIPKIPQMRLRMFFDVEPSVAANTGFLLPIDPSLTTPANWLRLSNLFTEWRMLGADVTVRSKNIQTTTTGAFNPIPVALVESTAGNPPVAPTTIAQVMQIPGARLIDATSLGTNNNAKMRWRANPSTTSFNLWEPTTQVNNLIGLLTLIGLNTYQANGVSVHGFVDLEFRGMLPA